MDALGVGSGRIEHAYRRGSFRLRSFVPLLALWLVACSSSDEGSGGGLVLASPSDSPSISLSAYPSNVQSGGFATLSWKANNLNSCTGTGGWSGKKSTEGTTTVGPLTETTVFTLECEDTGTTGTFSAQSCKTAEDCKGRGAQQRKKKSATVTVDDQPPPPPPTVSLDAVPTSVTAGDVSTLTWWSTDADTCDAWQDWSGAKPTSGSEEMGPLASTSEFALTCSNSGGATTQSAVVSVDATTPPPVPTLSLTASPTSVAYNGSTTVTWTSTDANFCLGDDAWSGEKPPFGSETIGGLTASSTFALTCIGDGGSASGSVTVIVDPPPLPTVTLTANPTSVTINGSSTLTWTSTNATTCTASGAWSGFKAVNGSQSVGPLTQDSTFTLTCTGPGGSASRPVTVTVETPNGTADLSWTAPLTNEDGSPVTLASFNIYQGSSSSNLQKIGSVGTSQTTYTVNSLPAGTHYFAVTAVSDTGAESAFSNVESKTIF